MSERLRIKPFKLRLNEGEAPNELQVLRAGNFNHPYYGAFSITSEVLQQMVQNFELNVRGVDLMIDYNHDCEEAAAWVSALVLKNNDSELWAAVEWTDKGREDVISKKYRYVSADFDEKYMDPETNHNYGPTLLGAALTNRPFVKNMAPAVELTETNIEGENNMNDLEKLKEENKKLSEAVEALKADNKKLSEKEDEKEVAKEVESLKSENEKLQKQVEEMNKEKALSEKKAAFNKLLAEGKAVKAQEEAFLNNDTVKFAELSVDLNKEAAGTGEDPKKTDESVEDEVIKLAEKMVEDGKANDLGEAQSMVLAENPELKKKLYA